MLKQVVYIVTTGLKVLTNVGVKMNEIEISLKQNSE
jgi:hypothetical protein